MALAVQTAMPQFFLFAEDHDAKDRTTLEPGKRRSQSEKRRQRLYHNMWDRLSLHKFGNWLKKEENGEPPPPQLQPHSQDALPECPEKQERSHFLGRRGSRKVVPSLPRPLTFRRQNSEKRDRLCPNEPEHEKRRAISADRRGGSGLRRTLSPPPLSVPSLSAPDIRSPAGAKTTSSFDSGDQGLPNGDFPDGHDLRATSIPDYAHREPLPPLSTAGDMTDRETVSDGVDDVVLQQELEAKWILNLSMHFRDLSDREKFFITYAEEPNKWRRVTISCDYRDVPPDSLEADLKDLHYQRDKSSRIYESIRDSLPDIQFYPTVTNLKLQTADGRLHVHVTEDVNEIIPYPSAFSLRHLPGHRFRESAVRFESHISGFVYKVTVDNRVYIKKEIPGPDSVEEFIYEINALCSLQESTCVIKYEGLVVDDSGEHVKGLLISYAEQGALVDIIFDWKGTTSLPWARRELWAKQIVQGLSEIHEGGFVQGDFTLSNIVIDSKNNAKIIDINRRGCPVGWEPPELTDLIQNGLRISIYIGVKSDLFQLGMVLWALAMEQDEPERQERPLSWDSVGSEVPRYFKDIVDICLSDEPRRRLSAKELLSRFPAGVDDNQPGMPMISQHSLSSHRSEKEYIDPAAAVELVDIERSRHQSIDSPSRPSSISAEDLGFGEAGASTSYRLSSAGSYVFPRGRPRGCGSPHGSTSVSASASRGRRSYNYSRSPTGRVSSVSLEESDPDPTFPHVEEITVREPRWEEIYVEGDTKLIHRSSGTIERHDISMDGEALERLTTMSSDKPNDEESPNAVQTPLATHREEQRTVSASTDTLTPTTASVQTPDARANQESRDLLPHRSSPLNHTPPYHGSFHDRVQLRRSYDKSLADLEEEILKTSPASQSSTSAGRRENADVPLAPSFDRLRHYDSGFHEPGITGAQSTSRTTAFGSPPRETNARVVARDPTPPSRNNTFGPPLHADSGFPDMSAGIELVPPSNAPEKVEEMSASIGERTKEDEAKVRDAIQKIMRNLESSETLSNNDANPRPK